ncbi:MAG: hypothetical protein LEGION0398_MBIBDBAK_01160 [Legionellaceae bacterium]
MPKSPAINCKLEHEFIEDVNFYLGENITIHPKNNSIFEHSNAKNEKSKESKTDSNNISENQNENKMCCVVL